MSDSDAGWQDCVGEDGQSYRIKATEYDITEASTTGEDEQDASGPPFDYIAVDWTVGSEGAPSMDIQERTAIYWYKLSKAPRDSIYEHQLTIATKDIYSYIFSTKAADSYNLVVYQNVGTHIMEFKSNSPTIISISGK